MAKKQQAPRDAKSVKAAKPKTEPAASAVSAPTAVKPLAATGQPPRTGVTRPRARLTGGPAAPSATPRADARAAAPAKDAPKASNASAKPSAKAPAKAAAKAPARKAK
jgi:hypothetical protein